jgi:nicotinate-nucleotide adenylyltransferase
LTYVDPQAPRRVGVLGGTFDPIHLGHLITVAGVQDQLCLDHVLFVPNRQPPHKTEHPVTRFRDRVAMVRLAIASNPTFRLDLTEIERPGPSYAVETLRTLRARLEADRELVFILGLDALLELDTWHEPDALLAENSLVAMDRPRDDDSLAGGLDALATRFPTIRSRARLVAVPGIEISSSDIRRRVAQGRSIRYLVPEAVEDYIRERGLYARSTESHSPP